MLEEKAKYAAEYDDFEEESNEVLGDQGDALPFSKGFYLVGSLVASFNPYDLDAMDESVPLTKWALDQLLGYVSSGTDYGHYFARFLHAQRNREINDSADVIKKQMDWQPFMEEFMREQYSETMECVLKFKRRLDPKYVPLPIPSQAASVSKKAFSGLKKLFSRR